MAKSPCKCKPTECEECPEWIFTFADLVMLMMGFFVILWVLKPNPGKSGSNQDDAKQELYKLEGEIRKGFGYMPSPSSTDPVDRVMREVQMRLNGPGEKGKSQLERKGSEGTEDEVTAIRLSKQATVGGRLLFAIGDAEIGADLGKTLDEVAELIRGHRNIVMVKGHTGLDDFPENATTQQKMDLSLKRAQHVADYLVRVQGCSTFEPVIQRAYTAEGRASNRRVEVEATATLVESLQDAPASRPVLMDSSASGN
jgi:flagellar motor protein MotB